jgi:vanadium-dependent haloperoxidase-like protein
MDPILFWNGVALEANRISHTNGKGEQTGPTLSARALAIVHLATYEAFARVVDNQAKLPFYLDAGALPKPAQGASPNAAVAGAAHKTLSELFPSQRPFFDLVLAGAGNESNPGHSFGEKVGEAILADREKDPGADGDYKPKQQRGKHRPDPDNPGQGFHAPIYGAKSKGFAITKRHELADPPFDNDEYRRALREVRGKGIAPELMGTLPNNIEARTVDETAIGLFWGYDGAVGLGTPPRLYNQIIRRVAGAKGNSVADNARLFAFVNVAMADAGILAWDQKYIHELWRPVLGVREHDVSMGPGATQAANNISDDCDSSWLPLGAPNTNRVGKNFTPPFPAYPSGHATFGAAALHITRLFYGPGGVDKGGVNVGDRNPDDLFDNLDFVSDELDGINTDNKGTVRPRHRRNFPGGLWQMIEENGRSRVYLGVHWVFDAFAVKGNDDPNLDRNVGGVPLGLKIAEDIFTASNGKAPKKSKVPPRA